MKEIAVLSDIHGNYIALKRCVEYVLERGIQTFFFLGDYLGELAYPQRTMEMLYDLDRQYDCLFIRGNKEDYWLTYAAKGGKWQDCHSTTGSLVYTYSHLRERDLKFYQSLEISRDICIEGMPKLTACHGSPYKVNDKMFADNPRTYEVMDACGSDVLLCGHTHVQDRLVYRGRKLLNPGSVGVPLYSGGLMQFLILHGGDGVWEEELISLPYDTERVIAELYEEELDKHAPCWCRVTEYLLRKGDICHADVLERAMELCRQQEGSCVWPDIPESCWEQAVKEMIG